MTTTSVLEDMADELLGVHRRLSTIEDTLAEAGGTGARILHDAQALLLALSRQLSELATVPCDVCQDPGAIPDGAPGRHPCPPRSYRCERCRAEGRTVT